VYSLKVNVIIQMLNSVPFKIGKLEWRKTTHNLHWVLIFLSKKNLAWTFMFFNWAN